MHARREPVVVGIVARKQVRRCLPAVAAVVCAAVVSPLQAEQTVTLAPRQFMAASPAAPFQSFFSDARRLAASTTPAWRDTETDLAAWGAALIFSLLERTVPSGTVLGLAAPLEAEGTAPTLMFRTLGLYAAKSRTPFADTPTLMKAINRNLRTLERATSDLEALTKGPGLSGWGSVGVGAWLAYLDLLYRDAFALVDPGAVRWNSSGIHIVDQLLVRGRLSNGGFRNDPRDEQLTLWPNALAIYALVKAYENEESVAYESAAIAAAAAIEALRAEDGSYFSTTAKTEKDPRANAYLAGALVGLFKDSGDVQYRDRALAILRWLTGGSGATTRDASIIAQTAYVVLLLDSLATQAYENLIGRRPMRVTVESGAPAVEAMAARLRPADFRYREMFDGVLHTLVERTPQLAGDFAYDYGDSPGYAATVLLDGGDTAIAPQIIQRQEHLLRWPRLRDVDEISFGAAALSAAIDHPDAVDAAAAERSLRRSLLLSGSLAFVDRYYCDWLDWLTGGGGFEYGPTVIGAQLAAAHLRYAERVGDQRVGGLLHPLQVGRALIAAAERAAWDATRHVYRTRPESEVVGLLPNAMMILDLLQAYQLTGEASYLERAEEVTRGLEALWDDGRKAYVASSDRTGEQAYESLSTNSYAALALLRLSQASRTDAYRERALAIFDFISRDLYGGGVIAHHLYRGRRAGGDIWCAGCNWRVLSELTELARSAK